MGVRRAELAGLEWKDIGFEDKTMTIARSRSIPAINCNDMFVCLSISNNYLKP